MRGAQNPTRSVLAYTGVNSGRRWKTRESGRKIVRQNRKLSMALGRSVQAIQERRVRLELNRGTAQDLTTMLKLVRRHIGVSVSNRRSTNLDSHRRTNGQ